VFPLLLQYGFTGTFFVIAAGPDNAREGYMTWPQIAEMSQRGMSMENHTRDHPDLRGRDHDFLVYQLLGAQESLQAHTGRTPHMLSYPSGQYDEAVLAFLPTLPIFRAVTTEPGALHTTDNRYELPRLRVHGETTLAQFAVLLNTRT
jgi:peptidoglycan/xylan/chitin deacetylase (PgdA/CDA1 family)